MSLLSGTPVILVRDSPKSEKYSAVLDLFSSSYPLWFLKYEPLIQSIEKRFEASPTNNSSEVSHAWREDWHENPATTGTQGGQRLQELTKEPKFSYLG